MLEVRANSNGNGVHFLKLRYDFRVKVHLYQANKFAKKINSRKRIFDVNIRKTCAEPFPENSSRKGSELFASQTVKSVSISSRRIFKH